MKKIGLVIKEESERIIKGKLQDADSLLLVKYSGISSSDLNLLRNSLSQIDSSLMVLKNSIGRRLFSSSEELKSFIKGPCGLVFINKDLIATSRVLYNFSKETSKNLEVKAGFIKDRVITDKEIEALSKIPSLSVLHGKLVAGLKSPIFGLVFSLKQVLNKLVWVLESIKTQTKPKPAQQSEGKPEGEQAN